MRGVAGGYQLPNCRPGADETKQPGSGVRGEDVCHPGPKLRGEGEGTSNSINNPLPPDLSPWDDASCGAILKGTTSTALSSNRTVVVARTFWSVTHT